MHALRIVQQLIRSWCPDIHVVRLTVLLAAVGAVIRAQRLTLTEIGRAVVGQSCAKHAIKRIDRLLGNRHLARERFDLYRLLAHQVLGTVREPPIIVDWSDLTRDRRWQLLRAAFPIGGRCLTLYEEVHPLCHFANARVHRAFLERLRAMLPKHVTPIVITDAGFHTPWFKAVERLGWHWIGRIRGRDYVRAAGSAQWIGCKSLYTGACTQAQALGSFQIVRSNPLRCHLFLVKRPKKHRICKSVFGQRVRSQHSLKNARAQREPWLLAASTSLSYLTAHHIIEHYGTRMQIEEAFRDLKCARYGLGFELNLSRSAERLAALLLIALLSFFVLWLIAEQALRRGWQWQLQSNTRRTRPVLSSFNLARLIVRRFTDQLLLQDLPNLPWPIRLPTNGAL